MKNKIKSAKIENMEKKKKKGEIGSHATTIFRTKLRGW